MGQSTKVLQVKNVEQHFQLLTLKIPALLTLTKYTYETFFEFQTDKVQAEQNAGFQAAAAYSHRMGLYIIPASLRNSPMIENTRFAPNRRLDGYDRRPVQPFQCSSGERHLCASGKTKTHRQTDRKFDSMNGTVYNVQSQRQMHRKN